MLRGVTEYFGMKLDMATAAAATLMEPDSVNELINANTTLIGHHDMGTTGGVLGSLASFSAIYLLILDRTNWRTNMLTALLVPYIFLSLPSGIFHAIRGELGKWIAFALVVVRLFLDRHLPNWTEIPRCMVMLVVVAPALLAEHARGSWAGMVVLLAIGCYLLQEHIRATGGFRDSLTRPHGWSNTIGLVLLLVYPIWAFILYMI